MTAYIVSDAACPACGTTKRYATNGKCVYCLLAYGHERHKRKMETTGGSQAGLKRGFLRFGTTYERVLRHIHAYGPVGIAELSEELADTPNLSMALTKLVQYGFLHRVDYGVHTPGKRGGFTYGLQPARSKPTSPDRKVSQDRYRAARPLKVASVFDFRGRFEL